MIEHHFRIHLQPVKVQFLLSENRIIEFM